MTPVEIVERHEELYAAISAILGGKPPEEQGALIADLLGTFLAGHAPSVRKEVFELTIDSAVEFCEATIEQRFHEGLVLSSWRGPCR
jgi:hypothetical protein